MKPRAMKTGLPVNNLSLDKVDSLMEIIRQRGNNYAIDFCHRYGMTRSEMRGFIEHNCSDSVPKEAA